MISLKIEQSRCSENYNKTHCMINNNKYIQ
jgi:hypothetical protein